MYANQSFVNSTRNNKNGEVEYIHLCQLNALHENTSTGSQKTAREWGAAAEDEDEKIPDLENQAPLCWNQNWCHHLHRNCS